MSRTKLVCLCLYALPNNVLPDVLLVLSHQFDEEVRHASPATRRALAPAAMAYSTLDTPPPYNPAYDRGVAVLEAHPPGLKMNMIRFPSTFQRPSPSAAASLDQVEANTSSQTGSSHFPSEAPPPVIVSRGVKLKQQPLWKQLLSGEFLSATALLTIASFWANLYIGAVDLEVQLI